MKNKSVIFLCTGNICRSPMGEALLKHAIAALPKDDKLHKLDIISAGISAMVGWNASSNSITALEKVGVKLEDHKPQQLTEELLKNCFALVAMDEGHLESAKFSYPNAMPKNSFTLLSLLGKNGEYADILDPYGFSQQVYDEVRDEIASAIPALIKFLEKEL